MNEGTVGGGDGRRVLEVQARTVDEAVARGLVRLGGLSRNEPSPPLASDSSGWYAPRRSADSSFAQDEPAALHAGESLPGSTSEPSGGFTGRSRYERSAPAAATEFPGQHLPDVAPPAASPPPQRMLGLPSARVPGRPVFAPAQPAPLMPCFGGS